MVRSIGADHVVDYTRDDFAGGSEVYDVIIDVFGDRSLADCRRALTPRGTYVSVGGSAGRWFGMGRMVKVMLVAPFVSQRLRTFISANSGEGLTYLKELVEAGKLRPVIDRTYPLGETAAALSHVGEGHAHGKTVITV